MLVVGLFFVARCVSFVWCLLDGDCCLMAGRYCLCAVVVLSIVW